MVPLTLHARGLFPFQSPLFQILGGLGPTIAAVLVALAAGAKTDLAALFRPLLRARVGIAWYLVAFLGMPLMAGTALGLTPFMDSARPDWAAFGPCAGLAPLFLVNLISNVWGEIGWRGFALPHLQNRHSALVSSLIVGLLWGVWHVPLVLSPSNPMSAFPWYAMLVNVTAMSVIYAWIYNNTGGSLLLVTLVHAASNTVAFFLDGVLTPAAFGLHYRVLTGVIAVAAVLIILGYGGETLSRGSQGPVERRACQF